MAAAVPEEQLDPRIQVELEKLNTATDDINKLESKLEETNNAFSSTFTESTARLKSMGKKLGNCIEKARPYYEALELARTSQLECQRVAVQYQRANALHQAAKETIALAEKRFVNSRHKNWQFDSAWQEMLNHATMKDFFTFVVSHWMTSTGKFKASKDSFTVMLGCNGSGDYKLKPMLIYHSENPRAFKGYDKALLPVHWYANKKGWITSVFSDYSKNKLHSKLEI